MYDVADIIKDGSVLTIISTTLTLFLALFTSIISRKHTIRQEKLSKETLEFFNGLEEETTSNISQKTKVDLENNLNVTSKKFDDRIEGLIQNHHEQAITQSVIQFWFSLIASVVGFVFIIVIVAVSEELQWYEYIVKTLPGVIIEAVSVLFFSQSKETRERASDFLNRLREDRQYAKSINLVETISDEKLRSLIKAEIALHLCGIKDINVITKDLDNGN